MMSYEKWLIELNRQTQVELTVLEAQYREFPHSLNNQNVFFELMKTVETCRVLQNCLKTYQVFKEIEEKRRDL